MQMQVPPRCISFLAPHLASRVALWVLPSACAQRGLNAPPGQLVWSLLPVSRPGRPCPPPRHRCYPLPPLHQTPHTGFSLTQASTAAEVLNGVGLSLRSKTNGLAQGEDDGGVSCQYVARVAAAGRAPPAAALAGAACPARGSQHASRAAAHSSANTLGPRPRSKLCLELSDALLQLHMERLRHLPHILERARRRQHLRLRWRGGAQVEQSVSSRRPSTRGRQVGKRAGAEDPPSPRDAPVPPAHAPAGAAPAAGRP